MTAIRAVSVDQIQILAAGFRSAASEARREARRHGLQDVDGAYENGRAIAFDEAAAYLLKLAKL